MAEIFVSPGVYVRERDYSFYTSSIGQTSLGLVGETKKGPANIPTLVSNMNEFRSLFGDLDPNKMVGYAAKSYFKYANSAYVVRVLGGDDLRTSKSLVQIKDTGGSVLATLLAPLGATGIVVSAATTTTGSAAGNFLLVVSGSATSAPIYSGNVNLVDTSSPVYVETLFPRNNTVSTAASSNYLALQHVFPTQAASATISAGTGFATAATSSYAGLAISGYKQARTPVIVGDAYGSGTGTPLFTIYTIGDGIEANKDIKVVIENVDTANTTFDIVVRKFSDTNASPVVYERFSKLSMDPTSKSYILKAIGDSRDQTGDYELISKYIYVQVESGAPKSGLPMGFDPLAAPLQFPQIPMTTSYVSTTSTKRQCLGADVENCDDDLLMTTWASQWDIDATGATELLGFHLNLNGGANESRYNVATGAVVTAYTKTLAKFMVPVLGGSDGWEWSADTRSLLATNSTTSQETQWKAAIDTLRNPEEYFINLLAVPGVAIDDSIATYAKEMAEERADCLYVADMPDNLANATAAANVTESLDSNYMCTYWPYIKIYDSDNEQEVTMPPTPQVLEAMAYTDSVSYPWFAVAGMNRGLMTDVIKAQYKLSQDDRDTLYEAKCNPIATFPGQGIAIWGQKTLQTRDTALNRINVRRMMLFAKKAIAGAAIYLDFEQNDETTWQRFKSLVQPILDDIKIKRGLVDFRVKMDETTNTPDMIERGQMVGQVYLKPTKTGEAILVNFNLMAQGAVFDD